MADNVNIIVQDTINDIVVNAAQIVETIDINVQAAVDVVDIVANPNNYVVNINRIIGEQVQSDWTQNDNQAPDYIKNKPSLAAVATSGDYDDLINKPTIPTNTSDLVNDGENGVDPFITAADIPPVTGFVPYTGATEDVNLGEFELKAGQLTLDTTPTGTAAVATTQWNDTAGVSQTTLKGGTVALKNGIDLVARVVNKVTPNATLLRANYTAVRISGAQGQRLAVAYAQANNDNNSADTIGLVCENIATNQEGFIMTMGQFEGINTTGSLQGETWSDGDVLYLSPTTAGRITNIKPTGLTGHIVVMGYVEYAHAIHGKIYVKIMNGWELDELHNVYINQATLANNDGLFYDSSDQLWKNKTIAAALGFTPENVANKSTSTSLGTSDTLYPTQNAVKVYADTKFTLPSFTSGSVLFSNGTTIAQDNTNLFWDDTNNRLGIGTATPVSTLHIQGNYAGGDDNLIPQLRFQNSNTTSNVNLYALAKVLIGNGFSGGFPEMWLQAWRDSGNVGTCALRVVSNNPLELWTNNTRRATIFANGNFAIGTTTDAGYRLDVNGTARINTLTIGLGLGQVATNTVIGVSAGGSNTVGSANFFGGYNAGFYNSGGSRNTAVGNLALYSNQTGNNNNAFGDYSFASVNTGNNNAAYGQFSGRWIANGSTPLTNTNNSVFIGVDSRANANSETNQIVIGYQAIGIGSNSVVLGNDSITKTALKGNILINTTTDAGYKLDVNGTARVKGTGTTAATSSFTVVNSASTQLLNVRDDAVVQLTTLLPDKILFNGGTMTISVNGTSNVTNFYNSGTIGQKIQTQTGTNLLLSPGTLAGQTVVIESLGGTGASVNNSAILQTNSTTQGFLPPRMTTTQKNAIATPAAGLVVYDTTLGKLCVRTAAAWETITSI